MSADLYQDIVENNNIISSIASGLGFMPRCISDLVISYSAALPQIKNPLEAVFALNNCHELANNPYIGKISVRLCSGLPSWSIERESPASEFRIPCMTQNILLCEYWRALLTGNDSCFFAQLDNTITALIIEGVASQRLLVSFWEKHNVCVDDIRRGLVRHRNLIAGY